MIDGRLSVAGGHRRRPRPYEGLFLFLLFFLICWGLGYPVLNRYDPRETPGMSDVRVYAAIVAGAPPTNEGHVWSRVLVPWLARPFFLAANGRISSWNPVMFGLLMSDSVFVAGTALLLAFLGSRWGLSHSVCLVASLLYLANFAVPNLRLAGLVDGGEAFFLLAVLASLSVQELAWLPLLSILGAMCKESFVVFEAVLVAGWWLVVRKRLPSPFRCALWLGASVALGALSLVSTQRWVLGHWVNPADFLLDLHRNREYVAHLWSSVLDQNLWYIFVWLLPLGAPRLRDLPVSWSVPTIAASASALMLDNYYGGAPGTLGRALFTTAGAILALSSAHLLCVPRQPKTGS